MPSQAQRPISVYRTIVLAGVTTLLIMTVASPISAQNSVPPARPRKAAEVRVSARSSIRSTASPPYVASPRRAS